MLDEAGPLESQGGTMGCRVFSLLDREATRFGCRRPLLHVAEEIDAFPVGGFKPHAILGCWCAHRDSIQVTKVPGAILYNSPLSTSSARYRTLSEKVRLAHCGGFGKPKEPEGSFCFAVEFIFYIRPLTFDLQTHTPPHIHHHCISCISTFAQALR